MSRVSQIEVGQAVVDQVHRLAGGKGRVPQRAVMPLQFAGIGHGGRDAVLQEQLPRQRELGRQVLGVRCVVHDQHGAQRRRTALRPPFGAEHRKKGFVEVKQVGRGVEQALHRVAAGAVRARQRGIEQGAAGVGVDLNQAWTVSAHVEVVAHEDARGPEGVPGDGRGVRQVCGSGRRAGRSHVR
jgi:hypothetical protein